MSYLLDTNAILRYPSYTIVDLTTEILIQAETISFYELHDRLILATAKYLGVDIVSSDQRFREVEEINVIW